MASGSSWYVPVSRGKGSIILVTSYADWNLWCLGDFLTDFYEVLESLSFSLSSIVLSSYCYISVLFLFLSVLRKSTMLACPRVGDLGFVENYSYSISMVKGCGDLALASMLLLKFETFRCRLTTLESVFDSSIRLWFRLMRASSITLRMLSRVPIEQSRLAISFLCGDLGFFIRGKSMLLSRMWPTTNLSLFSETTDSSADAASLLSTLWRFIGDSSPSSTLRILESFRSWFAFLVERRGLTPWAFSSDSIESEWSLRSIEARGSVLLCCPMDKERACRSITAGDFVYPLKCMSSHM